MKDHVSSSCSLKKNSMMILIVGSDVLFNHAERTKRYYATY